MGAAEELLASALAATAQRMEELAQAVPSERLGETKHLTPALRAEVEALLRASGSRGDAGSRPLELDDWKSGSRVDLGFELHGSVSVLAELKWGDGRRALGECAWDLAKLGLALARRKASHAFIVAGSSRKRWLSGVEGSELFDAGVWTVDHLRGEPYMTTYWRAYAREKLPHPTKLPSHVGTTPLSASQMVLGGEKWELRASAVIVEPRTELVDIPRLSVE